MSNTWDCDVVVVLSSRSQKNILKQVSGNSRTTSMTVGGQSYEMMQFDGVGLCACGVSSSTQSNARIAKLVKIDKYFKYEKVILVSPNYKEAKAKRAHVGVKDSWYFVYDNQALMDLLKIKYDELSSESKKLMDKLIPPTPPRETKHPLLDRSLLKTGGL